MNNDTQTVWREGDRIRSQDGTGYSDRVTDRSICEHIRRNRIEGESSPGFIDFALDVLSLRRAERMASA